LNQNGCATELRQRSEQVTKRQQALIPLTHDHHHALSQARHLRLSAKGGPEKRLDQAKEFMDFFHEDTIEHFRQEEEIVFPLAIGEARAAGLLGRVMVEHLQIHALAGRLSAEIRTGEVSADTTLQLADTLEAHIRLEEKELFPLLEEVVPANELAATDLAWRRKRSRSEERD
jgi:iron-sulfur cluster repair protein YtfE (RIC family)